MSVSCLTQEQAVLTLLRARPHTTRDFCTSLYGLASEYRRAVSTLRRKGYVIEATRLRKGCWEYTLKQEPMTVQPNGQFTLGLVNA